LVWWQALAAWHPVTPLPIETLPVASLLFVCVRTGIGQCRAPARCHATGAGGDNGAAKM
jgi:hypothetical protein